MLHSPAAHAKEQTATPPVSAAQEQTELTLIRERVRANARRDAVPAADAVDKLLHNLSPQGTWPDVRYADTANGSWSPTEHLSRVQRMALAYAVPTQKDGTPNPNFHRAPLLAGLLRAYDGWFTVLPPGTPPAPAHPGNAFKDTLTTPTSKNWWHNEIGVPLKMAAILLLLPQELSPSQTQNGLHILARSWVPSDTSGTNTASNLSWRARVTIARAVLTNDATLLRQVIAALDNAAHVTDAEGIQADYSFWQHGPQFYLLGYGLGVSLDMTEISELTAGTSFAFRPQFVGLLSNLTLDGYQWVMRGPIGDYNAMGRGIANPRKDDAADPLTVTQRLLALNAPRRAELEAFQARLTSKPDAAPLVGNRMFWRSGLMSHQRTGYGATVRVTPQNLRGGELINGQGMQSRYTGDGVTYLLRGENEYRNLSPVVNFRRLPGTTGALSIEKPTMPGPYVWGVNHFAGGVSDGLYGATGYDYSRDGVSARKGWFFFDDEYVCLGAGISAASEVQAPITSSVEQCRLVGSIARSEANAAGASWVLHNGAGYVFPTKPDGVTVETGPQTGSWRDVSRDSGDPKPVTENVFSVYLNHGVHPQNAHYAYVVVPQTTPEKLPAYAAHLPVEVLSNTPACQAVRHAGLKITQAVFYAPGKLNAAPNVTVSVSHPCLLLLRSAENGGLIITLADPDNPPTREYDNSSVQQFLPKANPPRPSVVIAVDVSGKGAKTTRLSFTMPTGEFAGQSVSQTLKRAAK